MKAMNLVLMCFSILIFSCESKSESIEKDILAGTWKLDSVYFKNENKIKHYPETLEQEVFIEFINSSEVDLTGYCNAGSASYVLNENTITFENVSLSEKACPYVGGEWEAYLYELPEMISYNFENSELNLISKANIDLFLSKLGD